MKNPGCGAGQQRTTPSAQHLRSRSHRSPSSAPAEFLAAVFFQGESKGERPSWSARRKMASAAGTPVDDACVLKFKDLKSKRKYKFVTYKIEGSTIVVGDEGAPTASFDDFVEALPENDPR